MAYTLGTIEFRSQFAPQRLSEGRSVNYTKLPTIEGTPVMQRTFTNLAEFSITIFLHFDFVNVAQAILDLKAAQESSEANVYAGLHFGRSIAKFDRSARCLACPQRFRRIDVVVGACWRDCSTLGCGSRSFRPVRLCRSTLCGSGFVRFATSLRTRRKRQPPCSSCRQYEQ